MKLAGTIALILTIIFHSAIQGRAGGNENVVLAFKDDSNDIKIRTHVFDGIRYLTLENKIHPEYRIVCELNKRQEVFIWKNGPGKGTPLYHFSAVTDTTGSVVRTPNGWEGRLSRFDNEFITVKKLELELLQKAARFVALENGKTYDLILTDIILFVIPIRHLIQA